MRAAVAAVGFVLGLGPSAHAGQNERFGAEPFPSVIAGEARRSFDVPERAAPGLVIDERLRVYNRTAAPIRLSIYPTTASMGDGDVIEIGAAGDTSPLVARIAVARTDVVLQPRADAKIAVRVTLGGALPTDALAAVVVEGAPLSGSAELDLVQRIAILVRATGSATPLSPTATRGVPGWLDVLILVSVLAGYRWRRLRAAPSVPR